MVSHDENNGGCMSVLIKDMEIPKCCDDCHLNYDQIHCIITGTQFYYNDDFDCGEERLPDCPLIEIIKDENIKCEDCYNYDFIESPEDCTASKMYYYCGSAVSRELIKKQVKAVKSLRDKTGAGMMDCLMALRHSDWNEEEAIEWLKKIHKRDYWI